MQAFEDIAACQGTDCASAADAAGDWFGDVGSSQEPEVVCHDCFGDRS